MNHYEKYEDTQENNENEWLPYLKSDVSSSAFCYARLTKGMEEIITFGMKKSLILPSLADNFFSSLGAEKNEPFDTYNNEYKRFLLRNSIRLLEITNWKLCSKM